MTVKYLGGVCFSIMYSIKKKNILAKTKFLSRGRVLDHDYVTSMGVGLLLTVDNKGGEVLNKSLKLDDAIVEQHLNSIE